MIFSVSNDGIEWSLDFGTGSVSLSLTVKDLVQEMTTSSQETFVAARTLLLSQRQEFSSSSASFNYPQPARDNRDTG